MVIVLVEVIIADLTSTRSRLFFSYIPATPFIMVSPETACIGQNRAFECFNLTETSLPSVPFPSGQNYY